MQATLFPRPARPRLVREIANLCSSVKRPMRPVPWSMALDGDCRISVHVEICGLDCTLPGRIVVVSRRSFIRAVPTGISHRNAWLHR